MIIHDLPKSHPGFYEGETTEVNVDWLTEQQFFVRSHTGDVFQIGYTHLFARLKGAEIAAIRINTVTCIDSSSVGIVKKLLQMQIERTILNFK